MIGIDLQLYNSFNLTVEAFKETRRDIFLSRGSTIPDFLGLSGATVYANLGKMKNIGMDLSIDYNKQVNKDLFSLSREHSPMRTIPFWNEMSLLSKNILTCHR